MPTQDEILQELQRRSSGFSPRQQEVLGELQRRMGPGERVYRTTPDTEAIQEAFPSTMVPRLEHPGETGAFVGEVGGQLASAATGPVQPIARPVFGAAGAALGSQVERFVRGEPVDRQQALREGLVSLIPEAGESLVRGATRTLVRTTRGAQELRRDTAARIATDAAQRIYHPPGKAQVDALYHVLDTHQSQLLPWLANDYLQTLPGAERRKLMQELHALSPTLSQKVADGDYLTPKEVTQFRSLLGQQAELLGNSAQPGAASTRQLLKRMQQELDHDLDEFLETVQLPGAAQTAKDAYYRLKAAERLTTLLTTSPVTKSIKGGDAYEFDLDKLHNMLKDNKVRISRDVNRDLTRVSGAREAFDSFFAEVKRLVPDGKLTFTDTSGLRRQWAIAGLDRGISALLTTPLGQQLFRQAIVQGRGRLSLNTVASIVSLLRRQDEGQAEGVGAVSIPPDVLRTSPAGPTLQIPRTTEGVR
jgi:hypothetical protein